MPPLDSAAGPDDQLLPAQNAPDPWSVVGTRPLAQPQPETPAPSASREWDVVDQKPLTQAAPTAPPTWAQPGENEKPPEWHEQPQPLGTAAQPYEPLDPAEYGSWLKSAPKGSVVRFPSGSTWTKPYDQPPEPPSVGGVALRAAERGLVPATTGLAGAGIGAEAGAAAGALFGPAAPVAIPAGAILGGLAGAVGGGWAGEKAQELILKQLPDWAVHALGQLPKDQQADIAAHSIAALAGTFIPNAAFFSPLAAERAAVPYAENVLSRLMQHPATQRLFPATIMAGQEAGGELAEGEPPSPTKIAVAGAAGAAMQRPTALGERVLGAGTAALARLRGTAAPAAERAAQQPATTVNNEQQPSAAADSRPPVGSVVHLPGEAGPVPMTVEEHTPEGGMLLLDPDGAPHRMSAADIARLPQQERPGETAEAAVSQGAAGAPGAPGQTPTRLALPAPEVVYGPGSPWTSTGTGMIPGTPGFVMHRGAGAEALSALEAEAAQTARAAEPSGAPAEPPVGAGAPEGAARPAGTAAPLPEAAQAEAALAKEAQTPGPLQPVPEAALTPGAPPLRDYAAEYEANRARASRAEMAPAEARQPISTAPIHETTEPAFVPSTGAAVPIQYAIADARDLVTSHHDDLSPNTEYPQALQPRSRERAETEAQLAGILNGDPRDPEATFRPELLGENPDAANGAPIVGPEGYVESGNARTMAIRRAYDRGLPQAEQYQNYLRAQGYPIENTEQPVLVRINRANMDMPQREQLARDLNVPPQATMSATDRAMADAQQINPEMLGAYRGGDVFSAQNKPFWRGILDRIAKPAELPALTNPEGGLSPAGQARIRSAVLAKAYGDPDIVAALTEDPDSNIKAIGNALTDAAPRWAQLRQAVAEGHISKTYDQTSPLLEAVRLVSHARSEGRNVAEFMRQGGLFGEGVSPETESIMRWMLGDPEWSRRFGREKIADALDEYADSVLRPLRLGEVRAAPMQLVGNAREVAHGAAGDLFASPLGQPGGAGGFREGAGEGRPETQGPEVAAPRVGTSAEEPRAGQPGLTLEQPARPEPEGEGAYRNTRDDYLAYRANTAYPETPEGAHASARGYVRQRGAETGNEYIAIHDPQWAGITHVGTNDLPDRVSFATEGLDERLADPNAGLTIHHNHPGDAALSGTDIAALAHPGVHQVVAHAHGEDVFAARLTPETQAAIANLPPRLHGDVGLSLAYQKANSIVRTALQMQTLADKISPAEFDDLQADLVNRALDAAGIIDYVGTRAPSELPERVRRSIIGRAAGEAADSAGVNLKLQPPTDGEIRARLDRSTLVSRPDEAMAGISGIAPERGPERPAGEAAPAGERAGIGAPAEGAEALVGRGARGLAEEPSDAEIATRLREPGGGEPPEEPPRPPPTGGAPPGGGPPRPDSSAFLKRTMATDETTGFGRLRQRVNDFLHDRPATRFRAYWQDELAEAARVQKGLQANGYTPARISPVASARFARNYRSTVRMVWTKNQGRYDPVRGMVVPIDGSKSGQAIIDQLRHDREFGGRKAQDDFAAWYIANRSEKLMSEGRERLVTRSDIDTFKNIDQHYQRADGSNLFHQVKGDLSEFNSRLLDLLEASGYINREGRSLWEHEFYVPYYRALAPDLDVPGRPRGGTRSGIVGPPIRRLEGGAEKINNVYENMFLNTEALVGRAMDMIARREMRTMLLFNTDALTPMSKEARAPYGDPIIQDHLRAIGLDPTKLSDAAKEAAKEVWGALRNREPDVYTVFDYGKANHYRVNDPLMLKALTAAGSETTSGVMKLLTTPARVLRQAVVLDPAFAAAHNLRMAMHAWNLTGVNPIASFAGALRNLKSLEPDAVKLMTAGALSGKYDAGYSQAMRREFYSEGYQNSLLDTPLKAARFVRDWGEQLIQAADVGPRVAVYRKALAEGATDAEAMDRARDLLDFSTHGYGAAAMFLAQTVPFMNARWQGLSRTYRGFTGTDRNAILARTALVTAASLALWYENKDDPEYQRKPDWDRQYAMQIKVAPGTWFRLPAFYELGALGYTLPTMLADYFYGESSTRQLASAAGSMFLNVFRFNPIPVAIRPIEDVIRNQDSYTGAPIVNQREQDLLPDQRFGPSDSASIVAMAHAYNSQVPQALQVAPAMLQHLINGYLAGWGTYVTLAADYLGNEAGILPAKSAPAEMPMVGRFIHEEPSPSNRLLGDFYDLRTQTENVGNSIKTARNHGDAALAQQLQAAHPEWTPPLQSQFKTAGDALSKSRGQWQNAEMNPALTREQKTEARTKYYQQRDQLLDRLEPWMRQIEGLPARP